MSLITRAEMGNMLQSSLFLNSCFGIATLATRATIATAHKILKPEYLSYTSYGIQGVSYLAWVAGSIYFAPWIPLTEMNQTKLSFSGKTIQWMLNGTIFLGTLFILSFFLEKINQLFPKINPSNFSVEELAEKGTKDLEIRLPSITIQELTDLSKALKTLEPSSRFNSNLSNAKHLIDKTLNRRFFKNMVQYLVLYRLTQTFVISRLITVALTTLGKENSSLLQRKIILSGCGGTLCGSMIVFTVISKLEKFLPKSLYL